MKDFSLTINPHSTINIRMPRRLVIHPDTGDFYWETSYAGSVKKSLKSGEVASIKNFIDEKIMKKKLYMLNEQEKKARVSGISLDETKVNIILALIRVFKSL